MYYHWNVYVRPLSLLSAFEDTPVVPFVSSRVVNGNHASTVGSFKNDMDFHLQFLVYLVNCTLYHGPHCYSTLPCPTSRARSTVQPFRKQPHLATIKVSQLARHPASSLRRLLTAMAGLIRRHSSKLSNSVKLKIDCCQGFDDYIVFTATSKDGFTFTGSAVKSQDAGPIRLTLT
jgi:hypothetical protein